MLNNNLGELKKIEGVFLANSTQKMVHSVAAFAYLLIIQGNLSTLWGSYMLQGYSIGGVRNHVTTLGKGDGVSVEIVSDGPGFIIKNSTVNDAAYSLLIIRGSTPTFS